MGKAKCDRELNMGAVLGALAAKECHALQQGLAARKGYHSGIHTVRRACRRLRSLLAFLETSRDHPPVVVLNKSLRQLTHSFSDLRDAHVAIRTAQLLAGSHSAMLTPTLIEQLENRSATLLGAALERDPAWRRRCSKAARIAKAVETLDWQAITPSTTRQVLKHSVKRMKKARRIALEQRTDSAFHRWRRRARQVRYQLEFLRKARRMAAMEKGHAQRYGARIRQLGLIIDRLGWRQDFQVFLATLDQLPASDEVSALRQALTRKSALLSKTAPARTKNEAADAQAPTHSVV
jgi:CHAD domain-containing protein